MKRKGSLVVFFLVSGILLYIYGLSYLGEKAFEKGKVYYYAKDYKKAISYFKLAQMCERKKLRAMILTGFAYQFMGDYDTAIRKFQEVMAIDPKNDEASGGIFTCLLQQNRLDEAEKVAMERLKFSPYKEDVYEELARVNYIKDKEKLKRAKEYALKALYLNDIKRNSIEDRVGIRLLLSGILYNLGEYEETTKVLLQAKELAPDIPLVWKSLAQVYEKIGDKQKALENWQKVAELDKGTYDPEFRTQVQSKIHQLQEELAKEETEP